jgi:hypothetical protein
VHGCSPGRDPFLERALRHIIRAKDWQSSGADGTECANAGPRDSHLRWFSPISLRLPVVQPEPFAKVLEP